MNELKKNKIMQYVILLAICVILLLSYAIFDTAANLIQYYIFKHNLDAKAFPHLSIMSSRIMSIILILCLFTKFQQLNYQRFLLGALMVILVILPFSLVSYPFISGFSNSIATLASAWLQIYTPPAIRATITGVTTGMMSGVDIRSITMEKFWDIDMVHYHYILFILCFSFCILWWLSVSLQRSKTNKQQIENTPKNIFQLLVKYPYIFIVCVYSGFNEGLFYYSYFLGKEVLPNQPVSIYQYILSVGAFVIPIVLGRLADKYGIFFTLVCSGIILIICKFLNAYLAFLHATQPTAFYLVVFVEAGLAVSLWSLCSALIGDRLYNKGIFRAYAISSILFNIGVVICGHMYAKFLHSFELTKLISGISDSVFLVVVVYLYYKAMSAPKQE